MFLNIVFLLHAFCAVIKQLNKKRQIQIVYNQEESDEIFQH